MALLEAPNGVFRLSKLDLNLGDASNLPSLPDISPKFSLPPLDQHDAAEERLLGSLNGRSWYALMRDGGFDVKGKGRASDGDLPKPNVALLLANDPAAKVVKDYNEMFEKAGESSSPKQTFAPLKTWEVMDPRTEQEKDPALLSEGGHKAFEALLLSHETMPSLPGLPEKLPPVSMDLEELLGTLLQSTMGMASSHALRWVGKEGRFRWDVNAGRPEGLDRKIASESVQCFLDVATGVRRLEIILDSQSSEPLTPTHHALFHAVSTYLTLIKQHLSETIKEQEAFASSWNGSSFALTGARDLLQVLCDVMCWPLSELKPSGLPSRAASLLTHVYSHLIALHSTLPSSDAPQILCLAFILIKSSAPVLALLHQWIGLQDSHALDIDPSETAQPWEDLGITRRPAKSSGVSFETGAEARWEYEFTSKRMPAFIPRELRRTLFEAGRSLRLLRDASGGQHPLCAGKWGLEGNWGWGGRSDRAASDLRRHTRHVHAAVEHWHRSIRNRSRPTSGSGSQPLLHPRRKERKGLPTEFMSMPKTDSPEQYTNPMMPDPTIVAEGDDHIGIETDPMWAILDQDPGSHLATATHGKLWTASPFDELQAFLSFHTAGQHPLLPLDSPNFALYVKSHLLAPLLLHAELVSTALVSIYLEDLQVLDHFDILRAYWLGGDPGFSERVSRALFGREDAGAAEALGMGKRARTRARLGLGSGGDGMVKDENAEWGIGLGLGLSERAKWPPGGAELAYALRTTLVDEGHEQKGQAWEGIEDRVSFAIKPLMEDGKDGRRAKWLNPQAIEALDFLYLAYSSPPSVGVLFPKPLLEKYQHLHNFLLRLSRIHVVLNSLFYDVLHPANSDAEDLKIGVDARPRRPSSRGVVEKSDKGVLSIDKALYAQAKVLRFRMNTFIDALSRYILDRAIGEHWYKMRSRLEKLKRKRHTSSTTSRPGTPAEEVEEFWDIEGTRSGPSEDAVSEAGLTDAEVEEDDNEILNINRLHSIHSIVTFHHLTLDRILRACLLSDHPGQQVVFKVLMTLFSLILDLGKAIKELEKRWADLEITRRKVEKIRVEWDEKEIIFMHALERLSLRHEKRSESNEKGDQADQQDLDLLLGEEGAETLRGKSGGNEDLQDLLLRLRLRVGPVIRRGKYAEAPPADI